MQHRRFSHPTKGAVHWLQVEKKIVQCHDKPLAPDRGPERKSGKLGDQCQKLIQRGFCVTVKHSCVFFKEERIFDAGIAGSLPPL